MRNLIKFCTLIITASILLSSCKSNLSIMKRHYNNGYYVDYSKNNKVVAPETSQKVTQVTPKSQDLIQPNLNTGNKINKLNQSMSAIATNNKKTKANMQSIIKPISANFIRIIDAPSLQNNNAITGSRTTSNKVSDNERGEREALSLLWLVIVIVLVLWLIAIIAGGFGLGGLINLLLIIALILLVLWLLRII